jgi:twitching motility protein PilT
MPDGVLTIHPDMETVMDTAVLNGASDIIITAGLPPMLRIAGALTPIEGMAPLNAEATQAMLLSLIFEQQLAKLEEQKDLDFSITSSKGHRFRANIFYQNGSLAAALRLIPAEIGTLESLGLPVILERFAAAKQGLVLLTGPAGHGKTTTIAALVNIINEKRNEHIITVEDPIEFIFTSKNSVIEQREVHRDTPSFAQALRAVFREDPNVVVVGEMRDAETVEAALTIAETGHLVFASLHTSDAAQTADRIISIFPDNQREQIKTVLAASLLGVTSQRLVPRADGKGRVPAVEIMLATPAVRNLIREGKTHLLPNTIATSTEEGMISLDRALSELVQKGTVKYEDAELFSTDPKTFAKMIF